MSLQAKEWIFYIGVGILALGAIYLLGYYAGSYQAEHKVYHLIAGRQARISESLPEFLRESGMTAEQVGHMATEQIAFRSQSAPLRQEIRTRVAAWVHYVFTPGSDKAVARRQKDEILKLCHQFGEKRIDSWLEMRSTLHPEQLSVLVQFVDRISETFDEI